MQVLRSSIYSQPLKRITKLQNSLVRKENCKAKPPRQKEGQGVKQKGKKKKINAFKQAGIVATNGGLNQPIICLWTPSDGPELQR